MFHKSFKIKSSSHMRNSDKKTFKVKLVSSFPNISQTDVDLIITSKDIVQMIKICTHSNNIAIVYVANKQPLAFELNDVMYPSIFLLWKIPELIPCFTTYDRVFSKLVAGADLMLPGLALPDVEGPRKFQRFEKADVVGINITINKAPIAVGTTAHSSMDMFMAGGKGKCVNLVHCLGDKLCTMDGCTFSQIPELGPPDWLIKPSENAIDCNNTKIDIDNRNIENEPIIDYVEDEINTDLKNVNFDHSFEEMDELFRYCFLKTIKYSKKKIVLPMLTSIFFRTLMIPLCPNDKTLNIKVSSYKKLNKFLNKMAQENLIQIEEQPKGVEKITNVNFCHPSVLSFMILENDVIEYCKSNEDMGPNVSKMFTVSATVLPIFKEEYLRKGDSISSTDVRKHVTNYVKNNRLQSEEDSRLIIPNEVLIKIIKSDKLISWEDLMYTIYNVMGMKFKVIYDGNEITGKGKIEPIIISVATRTYNKKVTFIDNLELYGIKLAEFGKDCQHGVATSTSIARPPGKKSDQLLVQGNQVLFIGNLLQNKYKIPKKYIRGLELAPKNKK